MKIEPNPISMLRRMRDQKRRARRTRPVQIRLNGCGGGGRSALTAPPCVGHPQGHSDDYNGEDDDRIN